MQNRHLLKTIHKFLDKGPFSAIELTFSSHSIKTIKKDDSLTQESKSNSRIIVTKLANSDKAQLLVLDRHLFYFSFQFRKPLTQEFHKGEMLSLPKPLANGTLEVDQERLSLQFDIASTCRNHQIMVKHIYSGLHTMERFPA